MARPLARVLLIERVGVIEFDKSNGPGSVFPAAAHGRHAMAMMNIRTVIRAEARFTRSQSFQSARPQLARRVDVGSLYVAAP
jgi:hypothetical protein